MSFPKINDSVEREYDWVKNIRVADLVYRNRQTTLS